MRSSFERISIITCSFNQGQYIAETIESVLRQGYPNFEHIIVDGMSTDNTPEVLARYQHLTVIREPDAGQADAINKGFRAATGGILCFLNSDDTFESGALERVAREIDPSAGKYVVMGRCRFVDSDGTPTGIEHPSAFEDHEHVLAIWNGYTIPQPAVFWSREVYERCGGLDENEQLVLDYDLFCRYSRHYRFHVVDQLFATYRLHESSKSFRATNAKRLGDSIRVSRRYWPPWPTPSRFRLERSLLLYRLNRKYRAAQSLSKARELVRNDRASAAVPSMILASIIGPDVVWSTLVYPRVRRHVLHIAPRLASKIITRPKAQGPSPQTRAYLSNVDAWSDGWVGPRFLRRLTCESVCQSAYVAGEANVEHLGCPLELTIRLDDFESVRHTVAKSGPFRIEVRPRGGIQSGTHVLEVVTDRWFVPHHHASNEDHRPLAWRYIDCNLG